MHSQKEKKEATTFIVNTTYVVGSNLTGAKIILVITDLGISEHQMN